MYKLFQAKLYSCNKVQLTKPTRRKLSLFTKTLQYKYCSKFWTCPKYDV